MKARERIVRDDRRGSDYEHRFDDPKYTNSRIVVGNIGEKPVPREILDDRFNKYGRILGISQHRGYAYIQFESEECALGAIKEEHDTLFLGGRLDVRSAKDSRRDEKPRFASSPVRHRSPPPPEKRDYIRGDSYRQPQRDRSPLRSGNKFEESYHRDFDTSLRGRTNERFRSNLSPKRSAEEQGFISPGYDRRSETQSKSRESFGNYVEQMKASKINDCEILVLGKMLRQYAEMVEWRLKDMGISVGLLTPKENISVIDILEDMGAKGCPFVVVITPQNEIHKSVTVNILFGRPQEHRNMPLDEALILVKQSFEDYKRERASKKMTLQDSFFSSIPSKSIGGGGGGGGGGGLSNSRGPPVNSEMGDLKFLFRLLADNKQLTVPELDRVIGYLQDYRTRLSVAEGGPPAHSNSMSGNSISDERIPKASLNILGEPSRTSRILNPQMESNVGGDFQNRSDPTNSDWRGGGGGGSSRTVDAHNDGRLAVSPPVNTGFINFDNPSIKRALDNLIQSGPNLLLSLEAATSNLNTSTRSNVGGGSAAGPIGGFQNAMPFRSPPLQPSAGKMGTSTSQFHNQGPYQRPFYN